MDQLAEPASNETATLEDILITDQLATRRSRTPDYHAENEALHDLTRHMAAGTVGLMQALVEAAVTLCRAETAGISIFEETDGEPVFRWQNIAGHLSGCVGKTTPFEFSPCGVALALGSAQLFDRPYRLFTYLQQSPEPFVECLIIPLPASNQPAATIWIISHHPSHQFDREDLRIMSRLASFAAAVLKLIATSEENERLYREAQEAIVGRDSLIATIAHDLKTPLTSLKGRSQLLARRAKRLALPGTEQIQDGLAELPLLVDRMSKQIDELLDVSRLRAGQPLELHRTKVAAITLATLCIEEVQPTTRMHSIRLVEQAPGVVGEWDLERLQRVVGNLLSNAIKYSPNGGEIVVKVGREEVGDQAWGLITVRDRGMGIAKADLTKVFYPYWRAEQVKSDISGNGIGLTSVLQIVKLHGGTIRVESEPGQGSTFTIQLPLVR
ncbi:MAG: sensor histidine kinase [Thermomicrobiales bacterium]